MYRNRLLVVLSGLIILSVLLSACQPAAATTQAVEPTEAVDAPTDEPTEEPEPQTTRVGGWLDEIGMKVVGADSAITQIDAGDIDIYTSNLSTPQDVQASDAANLERSFQYGLYYELTLNPSEFTDGSFNPMTDVRIRKALNNLVDRDYINQEVYGGLAVPKYVSFVSAFADYARHVDVIRGLQSQMSYDPDQAIADIAAAMEDNGATMGADGKWEIDGAPVTLIFLIRTDSDGTRRPLGDYVAGQLELAGFTVTRQYGTSSELAALWVSGNVADGLWHVYTGAWSATAVSRDDAADFLFFDSPDSAYGFATLWQSYPTDPVYNALITDLANSNFTTLEQRREMISEALQGSINQATRIWLIDGRAFSPWQPNVSVAFDLAAGVDVSGMTKFTLRFDDQEGGTLQWGTPDLFVEPSNPVGGSNWTYDSQWQQLTSDTATLANPYTGLPMAQRLEKVDIFMTEGYPVGTTLDYVNLEFVDTNVVPEDAWIDWDPVTENWITVGEAFPDGLQSLAKHVTYYPAELYDRSWHDGSQMSAADFIMNTIMTFATGTPGSSIFDEAQAGALDAFKGGFKGWRILSVDPLTIEVYTDVWFSDAELMAGCPCGTLWPEYGYGQAGWHMIAASNLAEAEGTLAYTPDKAVLAEVEQTNYIGGPSLEILAGYLQTSAESGYIPFPNVLSAYITAEEATARYENMLAFYGEYGHFWAGVGPYILDQALLVEKTAVLVHNPDFTDLADKWAQFSTPKIATAEIDGEARVTSGEEATFDVFVTFAGEPYAADDIASVKYLLYDAEGAIVETGEGVLVEDGHYTVTLSADTTDALGVGSNKLEVAVVPIPVALPSFASFDFVTE
ncbi:MAG: ABC transporter substrate-binding protein [Anaerolineales bacterium]